MSNGVRSSRVFQILILVSVFSLSAFADTSASNNGNWKKKQEIWWNDAQLVKNAIVSYLRFLDANPELKSRENPYWEVVSLVLLLDSRNDVNTLNTLVSLASYNIGESGGEVYNCVLLRKGKKILPTLQATVSARRNECMETFSSSGDFCTKASDYVGRIQGLIRAIKEDQSCTIEK